MDKAWQSKTKKKQKKTKNQEKTGRGKGFEEPFNTFPHNNFIIRFI